MGLGHAVLCGFNTQPPEGGWHSTPLIIFQHLKFQHTAARRRLVNDAAPAKAEFIVSTHSRPKAAGRRGNRPPRLPLVSTHSRPKAAGNAMTPRAGHDEVSTHSRPKAAGFFGKTPSIATQFQHTAARRRLGLALYMRRASNLFQHTAARRRLAN